MADLVAAFAMSHYPQLTHIPEFVEPHFWDELHAGFERVRSELAEKKVDTLVFFANDHFLAMSPNFYPTFGITTMEEGVGPVEGYIGMDRKSRHLPFDSTLGEWLLRASVRNSFDMTRMGSVSLEHSLLTIANKLTPGLNVSLLWIFQNCMLPPIPSIGRCHELGRTIGQAIREWQEPRRVAVIGTGGLSHWLGTLDTFVDGRDCSPLDRRLLGMLCENNGAIAAVTDEEIDEGGNGIGEIRNWAAAAGAAGGPGEVIVYGQERTNCGVGIMRFEVSAADASGSTQSTQQHRELA
jgi:aromatic ring-opening dioxygenase catalytic subunit (LigB family)